MSLGRKGVFSNETGGSPTTIDIEINSTPFLSGVSTNQDIPVQNSENTAVGVDDDPVWRIEDIDLDIEDQNGNSFATPAIVVKDQTVTVTFPIAYQRQIPPQVTSIRNGDSAYLKANGYYASADVQILGLKPILTDWFTLSALTPNIHGNTNRFTATDGTQTYTGDGIVQDHLTGREWLFDATYLSLGLATGGDADSLGADTFGNCWTAVAASTYEGGTWQIPSSYDWSGLRLADPSLIGDNGALIDYAPFSLNSAYIYWSSCGAPSNSNNQLGINSGNIVFFTNTLNTTATVRLVICRWIP